MTLLNQMNQAGKTRTRSGNVIPDARRFEKLQWSCWYVIANRVGASFYRGTDRLPFEFMRRLKNPKGRLSESELGIAKPGRVISSAAGSIHHSLDQSYNHHEKTARDFAREIVNSLKWIHSHEVMTELILVAEPHFLGLLRNALPSQLEAAVKQEIHKEYSHMSDKDLYLQIKEYCLRG